MNPDNHQIRVIPADRSQTGEQIQFYAMPYQGFFISGGDGGNAAKPLPPAVCRLASKLKLDPKRLD